MLLIRLCNVVSGTNCLDSDASGSFVSDTIISKLLIPLFLTFLVEIS